MNKQLRHIVGAVALAIIIALGASKETFSQADQLRPTFTETACDLPALSSNVLPRLRCGTVAVPRDHENPSAGHFNLAVVVIRSTQQPSLPDPVVYINGGPGEPLTIYTDYQARHPYAASRDLILVDQRGTGRTEPRLCPDFNTKMLQANIAVLTDMMDDSVARLLAIYMACRDQAIAHGIVLTDFGTPTNAEDFEWVRQALGITRWNVFGESYGTTVAMTLVAKHPKTVRSVVLDSVYPPDPMPSRLSIAAGALEAFSNACAHEEDCSASFPDVAKTFDETLDQLGRTPLIVSVPPSMHMTGDRVLLTASLFKVVVDNLIYYPPAYPSLPRLINAVHDGDTQDLGVVLASLLADAAQLDLADNAAVECRDRPHLRESTATSMTSLERLSSICEHWSELGPSPLIPIGTTVPTLVLVGQFDPVAGPELSRQITTAIGTNARLVEFPRLGHNVRHFSPCGATIVASFIEHPTEALDTSCTNRRPSIAFLPKSPAP